MDRIEARIDALAADIAEVRRDLRHLSERVVRIEGALTGPVAARRRTARRHRPPQPAAGGRAEAGSDVVRESESLADES